MRRRRPLTQWVLVATLMFVVGLFLVARPHHTVPGADRQSDHLLRQEAGETVGPTQRRPHALASGSDSSVRAARPARARAAAQHSAPPSGADCCASKNENDDPSLSGEWSAKMEAKIWEALQGMDREFASIDFVRCHEPTCEIQFSGVDPTGTTVGSWSDFPDELARRIGKDAQGAPIVRQGSFSTREIYPGVRARVLWLSTEPYDEHSAR